MRVRTNGARTRFNGERDIVAQMGFTPIIDTLPRLMGERIFRDAPMGLRNVLLRLNLSERFSYDAEKNLFFINFEGHEVAHPGDVDAIRKEVEQ